MTERIRSRVQTAKIRFLRVVMDRVRNVAVREELRVEELLIRVERSQILWYGHVQRMNEESFPRKDMKAIMRGSRPRGRPGTRWLDKIQNLAQECLRIDPELLPEVAEDQEAWSANVGVLSTRPR